MSAWRDQRGQALVELALVVVILTLLAVGLVEIARVGHAYLVTVHASREGARVGALGHDDRVITDAVRNAASALDTSRMRVAINPPPSQRDRGRPLEVNVAYEVQLVAPLIVNLLPNPFPVQGRTVMRIE